MVSTEDVIEVYSLNGVQLHRNTRFFKMCSYNILDLTVNPWELLYEKPSHVIEQTHEVIQKMVRAEGRAIPYGMQPFLQKEKFEYALSLKTVEVTPRYIAPLYDSNGQVAGAFSTHTGKIIAEGRNSGRFSTI